MCKNHMDTGLFGVAEKKKDLLDIPYVAWAAATQQSLCTNHCLASVMSCIIQSKADASARFVSDDFKDKNK